MHDHDDLRSTGSDHRLEDRLIDPAVVTRGDEQEVDLAALERADDAARPVDRAALGVVPERRRHRLEVGMVRQVCGRVVQERASAVGSGGGGGGDVQGRRDATAGRRTEQG